MEKCEFCDTEFSVIGRRATKRLEEFQKVTGQIACDKCQKTVKRKAHESIIQDVIKEYMAQNPDADPVTRDVVYDMIRSGDPAIDQLFKGEE